MDQTRELKQLENTLEDFNTYQNDWTTDTNRSIRCISPHEFITSRFLELALVFSTVYLYYFIESMKAFSDSSIFY